MSTEKLNENWIDITKILNIILIIIFLSGIGWALAVFYNTSFDEIDKIINYSFSIILFCITGILLGFKLKFRYMSQRNISQPLKQAVKLISKLLKEKKIDYSIKRDQRGIFLPIPYLIKTSLFEIRLIYNGELKQMLVYSYKGTKQEHIKLVNKIDIITK